MSHPSTLRGLGLKTGLSRGWGSWGLHAIKAEPLAPVRTGPLWMGPQSPDAGGPFRSYMKPGASKDWWALRLEELPEASRTCPGEGTQHQPRTTSPSAEWFCRGWDLSVGRRGKGTRHRPLGLCPSTFCSLDNPGIDWLSWGFGCPGDQTWVWGSAAALWLFLITTTLKPRFMDTSPSITLLGCKWHLPARNARG